MVYGRDRAATRDNYEDWESGGVAEAWGNVASSRLLSVLLVSASLRATANICLSNICSYELSCSPLKSQMPSPFLSSEWHISLNCLTCP